MRKSSINIQKAGVGEFWHNTREKTTSNSIFPDAINEYDKPAEEAIKLYREDLKIKSEKYTERTGQKLQKRAITLMNALINLDKHHTIEDVKKVARMLEEKLDVKVYQIALHRDEGFVDEDGQKHVNYHAHIMFSGLDSAGQSIKRNKLNIHVLRELQDEVANILNMERGSPGKRKHVDIYTYKKQKKAEAEAIKKEKLKDVKNAELLQYKLKNKKLESENKRLREELNEYKQMFNDYRREQAKNVRELKEEISLLRKKMIQANREAEEKLFTAEDYKILSKLKKELNAKNVQEIETKLKKLREKIDSKILFSNSIHMRKKDKNDFNKKLYVFSKLINSDYKSLEKFGLNMDDYFFKKIPESDEILVGNKNKNLYLKVSEYSITANANPAISDSEVAEEIFRLATANGKNIMDLEPRGSAEFKQAFYNLQENYLAEILAKSPQKSINNIDI